MKKIVCLMLLCMSLLSCSSDYKLHALMNEWIGKKLILNDDARKAMQANDSLSIDYTIVAYVDSTVCMSCRFGGWQRLVNEMSMYSDNHINSLLIMSAGASKNLENDININNYNLPYVIYKGDSLLKKNDFPESDIFRTFLLDKDGKVVVMGNPLLNDKIYEMFKRHVEKSSKIRYTGEKITVCLLDSVKELGEIPKSKPTICFFRVVNNGPNVMGLYDICVSSSGLRATSNKNLISSGDTATIKVKITPSMQGRFLGEITFRCNDVDSIKTMLVKGTAK